MKAQFSRTATSPSRTNPATAWKSIPMSPAHISRLARPGGGEDFIRACLPNLQPGTVGGYRRQSDQAQSRNPGWIPAFAGMTNRVTLRLVPRPQPTSVHCHRLTAEEMLLRRIKASKLGAETVLF